MTDIKLLFDPLAQAADIGVLAGGLAMDDGLGTAVMISLFTDRRADPDDPVDPLSPTGDLRGWAGDLLNPPGDRIGSRLWLLQRAKMVENGGLTPVEQLVQLYATEALQWLIDDGVASRVECTGTRVGLEAVELAVAVYRGTQPLGRWKFVWNAQAQGSN